MTPRVLILRAAGTNCEFETAHAFELCGAATTILHVNALLEAPARLHEHQLLVIPGGFSYGDDINSGRIFANQLMHRLRDDLRRFIDDGKPIGGICNGFQVLVKTDLLPGPLAGMAGQTCTLATNDIGRYMDRWVTVESRSKKCVWTAGIERLEIPMAHGEGKFIPANDAVRKALWNNDQVALVYTRPDGTPANGEFPFNPNGSVDDIAGVCDATGLVFGMMPHPERHMFASQHYAFTSRGESNDRGPGLAIFENAVQHARDSVGAGA